MLNHIAAMGRITRDLELRYTQSGILVLSFSIACERDYKDQATGERGVDFIDCVAWRGSAEFIQKYFSKGRAIIVDGRLQSRDWTDNAGQKRKSWEVLVNNAYFGDSKKDSGVYRSGDYGATPGGSYDMRPQDTGNFAETEDDGDLPF